MPDDRPNYRAEFKELEQSYMILKDQYSELVRALGFSGDGLWGDPITSHGEALAKILKLIGT